MYIRTNTLGRADIIGISIEEKAQGRMDESVSVYVSEKRSRTHNRGMAISFHPAISRDETVRFLAAIKDEDPGVEVDRIFV